MDWYLHGKVAVEYREVVEDRDVVEDRMLAVDRKGHRMGCEMTHSYHMVENHPFRTPSTSRDPCLQMGKNHN